MSSPRRPRPETAADIAALDPFYAQKIREERRRSRRQSSNPDDSASDADLSHLSDDHRKRTSTFDAFLSGRMTPNKLSDDDIAFKRQWNAENGIQDSSFEDYLSSNTPHHQQQQPQMHDANLPAPIPAPAPAASTTLQGDATNAYTPELAQDGLQQPQSQPYQAGMVNPNETAYHPQQTSYPPAAAASSPASHSGSKKSHSSKRSKNSVQSKATKIIRKIPGLHERPPKEIPTQRRIQIRDLKTSVHSGNKRGLSGSAIMLSIIAAVSGFSFGYDTGIISGVLVVLNEALTHPFSLSVGQKQMITSSTILTALVAALIGGPLSDKIGRKLVLILSCLLYIIATAVMASSHTYTQFVWGRVILGFGIGASSLVAPMYISEISPALHRGKMIIINVFMITLGQLIAYAIGAGMNDTREGWRWMVGVGGFPSVLQLIFLLFLPESPRYLLFRGKVIQARKVLRSLVPGLREEEVVARLKMMDSERLSILQSLSELFSRPAHTRALVIGCGLQAIQQLSGFNALMYYSATLLHALGYRNPMAAGMVVAGTNCLFTLIAFFIIDRVSRRRLLLWTILGMMFGHLMIAVSYQCVPRTWYNFADMYHMNAWNSILLVSMVIFVAFYALGIGNLPWHQGEMFPTNVRGVGTAITTGINWLFNFIISFTFLTMFERIGPVWTFGFFGLLCISSEIFAYFLYPELTGLGIEEIDCLLTSGYGVKESLIIREDRKLFGLIEGEAI